MRLFLRLWFLNHLLGCSFKCKPKARHYRPINKFKFQWVVTQQINYEV